MSSGVTPRLRSYTFPTQVWLISSGVRWAVAGVFNVFSLRLLQIRKRSKSL